VAEIRVEEIANFLKQRLAKSGLAEARVVIFGSRASGAAREDSDVDVAIRSSAFRGKNLFERAHLTTDAEISAIEKFDLPFDIMTLTPEEYEGGRMIGDFIRASPNLVF
jgi:predicted nucleotidyltransferase